MRTTINQSPREKYNLDADATLTPREDFEYFAKDMCDENFMRALKRVKKVCYRSYVKPRDAVKVVADLMQDCEAMMVKLGSNWIDDYHKCIYCRFHRTLRADGTIGYDITINVVLNGQFMAG